MNIVDRLSRAQMASRDEYGMVLVDPSLLEEAATLISEAGAIAVSLFKDVSMGDLSVAEAEKIHHYLQTKSRQADA